MSLTIAGLLAPRALPLLVGSFYDRSLLAFVHLNTLGIIAAAMIAATFQVLPCALGVPFDAKRTAPAMFWLHVSGLAVFLYGFHQSWHPVLATGGMLLVGGLGLYLVAVVRALRRAPRLGVTGWHVAVSLPGLSVGMLLGFLLAGSKGTWFLGDVTMQVLSAHAVLMLGGWVLVMVNGVALHMVPMLSGTGLQPWRRVAFVELALVAAGAWLTAGALLFTVGRPWVAAGAIMIVLGEILFLTQMVRIYLPGLRVQLGPRMLFVLTLSLAGLSASGLVVAGLLRGEPLVSPYWTAAGWLAIGGVALAAIQGLAPVIGSEVTGLPLNPTQAWQRAIAFVGWLGWTTSLVLAVRSTLAGDADLARFAGYAATIGVGCFIANLAGSILRDRLIIRADTSPDNQFGTA
ncbi:MAG: hypothetical protein R2849_11790 [Thermomicrobiales bacterium]